MVIRVVVRANDDRRHGSWISNSVLIIVGLVVRQLMCVLVNVKVPSTACAISSCG